jgi:GT2 family glycosyltransferase
VISIILVNWNGWADTISCVQSILNSTSGSFRVIIIDNNSSDGSISTIESWANGRLEIVPQNSAIDQFSTEGANKRRIVKFGRYVESDNIFEWLNEPNETCFDDTPVIYVVDSGRNGGFGFGCNIGMQLGQSLGSSAYWLLNNDCIVKPDAVSAIIRQIDGRPRTVFGTVLRFYYHPDVIQAVGGGFFNKVTGSVKTNTKLDDDTPLNFINGASLILSELCLKEVGFFDESIFMYFEENDYCMRAAAAGYHFEVIPTDVYHKHGGSQGKVPTVRAWTQVLINKHYVLSKHIGWGTWMIFFYMTLFLRAVLPIGEKNARIGARLALIRLILPAHIKS